MMEEGSTSEKAKASQVYKMARKFGMEFQPQQQFEFFFYAAQEDNASNLAIDLHQMNYAVEPVRRSSGNGKWLINGWTHRMNSDEGSVGAWSGQMGKLAARHNCEFDGWGSFVDKMDKKFLL